MKEVTDEAEIVKLMKSKKPVAIFYYAAWCPHCKVMHDPWDVVESETPGVEFYKMESEDVPDGLDIPDMNGYPHFVLVKNGAVSKTVGGEMPKEQLKQRLFGDLRRSRRTRSRGLRRTVRKVAHRTLRNHVPLVKNLPVTGGRR